jgi:hypothetical protein
MYCYLIINKNNINTITKNEKLNINKWHFVCKQPEHINPLETTQNSKYYCKKYSTFYSAMEYYNNNNDRNIPLKIITTPILENTQTQTQTQTQNIKEYNFNQNDVYFYN